MDNTWIPMRWNYLISQCYPLGSSYLVGKSVKYRYIEFFTFDYDSLPISFQSGIYFFPLVALDKIILSF